jgi:signal transduction histidine kinase
MTKGSPHFEPVSKTPFAFDLSLIFPGPKEKIYFPSRDGLWIHDTRLQSWRNIGAANGLAAEPITAMLGDHEDNLWIGFFGLGLMRWLGYEEWEGWTQQEGLNSGTVWTLMRDSRRTLWAGTDNGLNYFDEITMRWRSLGGEAGKSIGRIMSLAADGPNVFWASSQSRGLVRVDSLAKTFTVLGFPKQAGANQLFNLFLDRESRLWLGTNLGLFQARTSQPLEWKMAEVKRSEETETIYTIAQDSRGRVWAAGNAGLLVLNEGLWSRLNARSGLLTNSTWFAREIRKDVIAVGYLESVGASLILWGEGASSMNHTTEDGSSGFMSYFEGVDKRGLHWTGTDQGVLLSNGKQVHKITDQDGLIWNDCNSNAFFADEDGSVWIGTTRGLAHARIQTQFRETIPALKVASLKVNGKAVEVTDVIRVPSLPNSIDLEVSPLSYRHSNRIEYQFRLGIRDEPWVTRNSGVVNVSGIPGGSTRMQARVKFGRQPWSETLIDLPVEVDVPFWQSWTGRAIIVLGLALGVALVWRYRNKKLIEERSRLATAVANRTSEIQRLLQEARETSRLKTEFLANMSHEIRTPMNGVLGMLQLTAGTQLNPEQRNFVDLAKRSAENLLSLLNEILDLYKVESGFLELDEQPFVLREAMSHICSLLQPNAEGKGIRIECHMDASLPVQILADRNRLQQVLLNLIGNAVKFTDSGFVKFKASRGEGDELHFMVEDSGIGIAPEKQAFIFDAFRQADGSTTRRFGGTGLGLAISQKLVLLMGGSIKVESEVGLGSRFSFSIPLKTPIENQASLDPVGPLESSGNPLRILLAEDNRVNQLVVTKLLERQGHSVTLVEDGALAVEAMQRQSFDLILMDIHMPVLDGIRATEKIRELESGKRIPIVALSAGVLAEERKRCFDAGMNAFIGKPVRDAELREMLARFSPG